MVRRETVGTYHSVEVLLKRKLGYHGYTRKGRLRILYYRIIVGGVRDGVTFDEHTYRHMARLERISGIAGQAAARRLMIVNLALRVNSACPHARVLALVVDAGFGMSAIRVLNTLRSTTLIRITGVIGQTSAGACAVTLFAYSVRAARRRIAWHLHREYSCRIRVILLKTLHDT